MRKAQKNINKRKAADHILKLVQFILTVTSITTPKKNINRNDNIRFWQITFAFSH